MLRRKKSTFLLLFYIAICLALYNSFKSSKQHSPNEPVKPKRLFCFILTQANNFDSRTKVIHDVWAKKCDGYRLISHIPDEMREKYKISNSSKEIVYNNMLILEPPGMANDTYSKLTDKIYLTIQYVYNFHNDYDWYLKADDDTYIFVENLLKFVSDKNPSSPVTYGYDFKVIVQNGYHSGGGGYLLSNEALKRLGNQLNKDYSFCPNTGKVNLFIILVSPCQS
jgi:glycoprotein-N-acetylgalactosamine 3-beta-galactosyltransferase